MPKLVLSKGGSVLWEIDLNKERITIGRRSTNDIVIDSPAISGEHAAIVADGRDVYLEDLNSTNGTRVNGQPVRKHFLQDGDLVELALYCIRYVSDDLEACRLENVAQNCQSDKRTEGQSSLLGVLKLLTGPKAGTEIVVDKTITTLGRSGKNVALITQRGGQYFLSHVEGGEPPQINGVPIKTGLSPIQNTDIIDLFGIKAEFVLTKREAI